MMNSRKEDYTVYKLLKGLKKHYLGFIIVKSLFYGIVLPRPVRPQEFKGKGYISLYKK